VTLFLDINTLWYNSNDKERRMVDAVGLNQKMLEVRALADGKGFSSDPARIWEMLALIHTEVSEATDAYKKGEPMEHIGEELADAIIRILHLMSALNLDAEKLFQEKMKKNWERPYKYNTVRGG
jgi:NTP pyrophosphatase (non-canonical NTP hydrolase)